MLNFNKPAEAVETRPAPNPMATPDAPPVTLAELAAEGIADGHAARPIDVLAKRYADHLVTDDLGRRCLPRHVARRILAEHEEAKQRAAEHWARQRERTSAQTSSRVVRGGIPAPDGGLSPVEAMLSSAHESELDEKGRTREEYMSGVMQYHPVKREA